jgi:hypothetical protein
MQKAVDFHLRASGQAHLHDADAEQRVEHGVLQRFADADFVEQVVDTKLQLHAGLL